MSKMLVLTLKEGTESSGFEGHAGRPGRRGGSVARSGERRVLTPIEEANRARNNMILRLAYNVQEDAAAYGDATAAARRRQSRQPIGEYLDGLAQEAMSGQTFVDRIVDREAMHGVLATSWGDVRFDNSDTGPLATFLNAAVAAGNGDVPNPAALQHPLSTPGVDARILGAMYDRLGHTTGPNSNDQLREVMRVANDASSTMDDVNMTIDDYNGNLGATGTIRDSEANQIRALYQDVQANPERGAASLEALAQNGLIQRNAQPAIDQILNTPAAPPEPYVISGVAPVSNIRNNIQNLQNAYTNGTPLAKAMIQQASDQHLERTAFNDLIIQAGNNEAAIRNFQEDLMRAYDFYHRADPYTSYFNSSDEVQDSYTKLMNAAANNLNPAVRSDMEALLNHARVPGTVMSRSSYDQMINDYEVAHGQLTPILHARASALLEQTQVSTSSTSSTQVQRRATPAAPRRPAVPEMTSRDVFDNYMNTTLSSASNRTETMGYSALRAAVVNPESTIERVDATITDFDNTFPGTLSNEAKAAYKAAYTLYHTEGTQLPGVIHLPGNVQELSAKAKEHKLADEIKSSVHVKPLTIAAAVSNASLFGNSDKVKTMNDVLRRATGNDSLDAVEFITDTYQDFEAGGLKVKISDVNADSSEVNVYFNVFDAQGRNVGESHRTLNADGEIHNDLLTIDASVQGNGFGSALYKHTEDRYLKAGFKKVTIHANISGGGYSWAAMGFECFSGDFYPGTKVSNSFISSLQREYRNATGADLPYIPKHMWEVAAYVKPGYENTDPADIPEDAKLGKIVLRGSSWYAVKYLNDNDLGFPIGQAYYNAHIHPTRARRQRRR